MVLEKRENGAVKIHIHNRRRWTLVMYDAALLIITVILILGMNPSSIEHPTLAMIFIHLLLSAACIYLCRYAANVYKQIWRYGGSSAYIRLILADAAAGMLYYIVQRVLPIEGIAFIRVFSIATLNLLLTISIRMIYQFLYECTGRQEKLPAVVWKLVRVLTGLSFVPEKEQEEQDKRYGIRIAIVGAGRIGVMLADELRSNHHSEYIPCCFIDTDRTKIGREVFGIPVLSSEEATAERLASLNVQEVVFALPQITAQRKKELYDHYKKTGCRIKVYDYPIMQTAGNNRRYVREFDIEDLLFRQPVEFHSEETDAYYRNKVILITGGGGSIGSELCRQIAKMSPKRLIILDVYENGAYDIQQELKIAYKDKLDLHVEIVSICDRTGLEKVFAGYQPDIILHAAAHKHVPLMEHNCCEAVKNNVFGTLNVVELAEKYHVGRFIMISTDKAVNPTNIMGATKRMCEMLVQSHCHSGASTIYSVTRFGNVLGSAGSVIPLFKKQIMNGGPVTLTDKRIIRYFMTIPEASQLVLQSGVLARDGELFVLDMGKPVKILELAENMIRLSGYEPYRDIQIIETGLRPGEKLYEELLINPENLNKTVNDRIFVERAEPLKLEEVQRKLSILRKALDLEDDRAVCEALAEVVPTYRSPDAINSNAGNAREMKLVSIQ